MYSHEEFTSVWIKNGGLQNCPVSLRSKGIVLRTLMSRRIRPALGQRLARRSIENRTTHILA